MKLKEILLEMAIKIDTIRTRKYGNLDVQIRTADSGGGQSEHPPPHIHIIWVDNGIRVDTPVLISIPPDYTTYNIIKFKYSDLESIVYNYIIHNYKQLLQTFNQAQLNADPSSIYSKLQQDKNK